MRIALISDVHANIVALEAVVAAAGSVDAFWHTGDIVGYGPEPDAVVERLAGLGAIGVRGNHDAAAVGSETVEYFNVDARRAIEWTAGVISGATRAWLAGLPETRVEDDLTLVHGSPRAPIWEYITTTALARAGFDALSTRNGIFGHTHIPLAYRLVGGTVQAVAPRDGSVLRLDDAPVLLNPGSVGQPRDGDPDASFAILDIDAGVVTWRRVPYDVAATQAAMRAVSLPPRLVERIAHGR